MLHEEQHMLGGGARLLLEVEHGGVAAVHDVVDELHQLSRRLRALGRAGRHLLVDVADAGGVIVVWRLR